MTMHMVLHPGNDVDRLSVLKNKEEEDLLVLKITSMPRYKDSKTILKKCRRQTTVTRNNTRQRQHQQDGNNQKTRIGTVWTF